jgi:hypothetical protein
MKKFIAITAAALMLSTTVYASKQSDTLATWVNDKSLTLNDIVQKADNFDKNMNPHEGITCVRKDNQGYVNLVHPNPAKSKNADAFTQEEKNVLAQIFTSVNGKTRTEGVPVSYTVNKLHKEGTAYLIEKDSFCMAFEVITK